MSETKTKPEAPSPPRRRVAVYAGTFDPPTAGHVSVIERAALIFDEVIALSAVNPVKAPLFSTAERIAMLSEAVAHLDNVRCAHTEGLVVEYARAQGARFLVRGVRGATDADYETALAHANRELAPEIETVFLPADRALSEVSSSALKRIAAAGEDVTAHCPRGVAARLRARLQTQQSERNPEQEPEEASHDV
jgi:pantetheine-phosphate adenylyltransferase